MVEDDQDRNLSRDLAVYQRVSDRYQSHVTIMWQAPALGLAAEAFLMTVSLSSALSRNAHYRRSFGNRRRTNVNAVDGEAQIHFPKRRNCSQSSERKAWHLFAVRGDTTTRRSLVSEDQQLQTVPNRSPVVRPDQSCPIGPLGGLGQGITWRGLRVRDCPRRLSRNGRYRLDGPISVAGAMAARNPRTEEQVIAHRGRLGRMATPAQSASALEICVWLLIPWARTLAALSSLTWGLSLQSAEVRTPFRGVRPIASAGR
jgi:hypothetical protein